MFELRQPRKWPQNLQSLASVQLSDMIYQFIVESLDTIPMQANNAAQSMVKRAITIACYFEPNIPKLRSLTGGRAPTKDDFTQWRTVANKVQCDVLKYINSHKEKQQRQREQTGNVPGIIRVWNKLKLDKHIGDCNIK